MISSLKTFLYRRLFALAPKRIQELYFQSKVLVPKEELTQKFTEAIAFLKKSGPLGDYLEFGVFRGDSLVCMYQALTKQKVKNSRLFGFDSFEGLPEIKDENDRLLPWQKGEFISSLEATRRNLNQARVDWQRVFLIKGFFNKTLNKKLINRYKLKRVSIIMIDCDLYSSAKEALDFCVPLIKDRVIIFFDDWLTDTDNKEMAVGEKLAFEQMLQANPKLTVREFGTYTHLGQKKPPTAKIFLVKRSRKPLLNQFRNVR
ncbi:MAG: hypothetical protein UV73_C0022G0001 [Candidatus Gottesmanbacteria bacterium GW2011_GWA2_43_14]|uniref:Methyltransferase n=1 Tax=Candidatus Gottesmanbacteria bacterium GW2011_GWA2_43_14 TaxID=1618443 RepID=A0A0G1DBW4_9BACT|nr:MAG: hypothetical protein UV73_C0022G0001 [Candidatus Gottesmanbacteria bacterium GW2011_GWA2_43_14]